jgi:hypothetical protein
MIAFLIVVIWFFVVLPYLFRRMTRTVAAIEPPAPMAVMVTTPSIVIHVCTLLPPTPALRLGAIVASESKCLAQSNKSQTGGKATKTLTTSR